MPGRHVRAPTKRSGLQAHDVLMLNRQLLEKAGEQWSDDAIRVRTQELAHVITGPAKPPIRCDSGNAPKFVRKSISWTSSPVAPSNLECHSSLSARSTAIAWLRCSRTVRL